MRRHRTTVVPVVLVIAMVCAAFAKAGHATVSSKVPLTSANDGHDTVPVYVNGQGPFPFILDSGADGSAVYQWFADQARLPKLKGKDQDLSGQTGSSKVSMYRIDQLSLAGLSISGVEAFGLPNRRDAGKQAGVLGNDYMDKAVVAFDIQCRHVTIYPKPVDITTVVGRNAQPIKARIDPGTTLLTVPVTVNGFAGVAILDTGSRRTRLTPGFAKGAGIDAARPPFHDDEPIYGTSIIKQVPRVGPIGLVRVANAVFPDATGQVLDLSVLAHDFGRKPAMILGADLIGRYRFVYDHADQTVWFLPSGCSRR
ncbi:putative aspartyl protease [Rhodanobacter sp. ANJX3]|uniref:retroviral-like aspartic protease family protein n=1 Tax=unclassified Rhodanobacter TaxID=2621553 RepID=UPI0015CE987B|nr:MULTISPECIES: retroviral-like aspartic protease family protein [unclassified Rhodanobacter]MBB5359362.1 putative aspartyl protease [Rhodanobacter sp. ANJX3]NYE29885.1 putative aspartyl protease [Rhodanobacter sp. K2T2]